MKTNFVRARAKKMLTPDDIRKGTTPFNSKAWAEHKEAIKRRLKIKHLRQKVRKEEREEALKAGRPVKYSIK